MWEWDRGRGGQGGNEYDQGQGRRTGAVGIIATWLPILVVLAGGAWPGANRETDVDSQMVDCEVAPQAQAQHNTGTGTQSTSTW